MNFSLPLNLRAIVKYIVSMILMTVNIILGATSISFGLFVGFIVLGIFFPSQFNGVI